MKKLYSLLLIIVAMIGTANAQLNDIYLNDTLHVESVMMSNMSIQKIYGINTFQGRTKDGIYYTLASNWYVMYVPVIETAFRVYCSRGTYYSVGWHFCYLLDRIRKSLIHSAANEPEPKLANPCLGDNNVFLNWMSEVTR